MADAVTITYKSAGSSSSDGITLEQAKRTTMIEYTTAGATNALTLGDIYKQHVATVAGTFTLPPSSGLTAGDWVEFLRTTTDTVTIEGDGTDEMIYGGGASVASLSDSTGYDQSFVKCVWDGTVWMCYGEGNWS